MKIWQTWVKLLKKDSNPWFTPATSLISDHIPTWYVPTHEYNLLKMYIRNKWVLNLLPYIIIWWLSYKSAATIWIHRKFPFIFEQKYKYWPNHCSNLPSTHYQPGGSQPPTSKIILYPLILNNTSWLCFFWHPWLWNIWCGCHIFLRTRNLWYKQKNN